MPAEVGIPNAPLVTHHIHGEFQPRQAWPGLRQSLHVGIVEAEEVLAINAQSLEMGERMELAYQLFEGRRTILAALPIGPDVEFAQRGCPSFDNDGGHSADLPPISTDEFEFDQFGNRASSGHSMGHWSSSITSNRIVFRNKMKEASASLGNSAEECGWSCFKMAQLQLNGEQFGPQEDGKGCSKNLDHGDTWGPGDTKRYTV
ncbi:hypothetical protein CALVIDRAFT_552589 [Calocera viscosa TUFC12733]|uniref:Uncharacterized protein n=1 Tax=Calocera viscosa (strain TUFC12733) TaxID=1330018 RepID=A0A167RHV2_CALVF|nr:hypothetical protein CALVIDRAFT_552589 [Calocera viscosa TUFC12733]